MSHDWKPGDTVVAKHPLTDAPVRGIIDTDGWFYTTDQTAKGISSSAFAPSSLRPLVVIDDGDRAQVERLRDLMIAALDDHIGPMVPTAADFGNALQTALRELKRSAS